jgi:hypothetical protein
MQFTYSVLFEPAESLTSDSITSNEIISFSQDFMELYLTKVIFSKISECSFATTYSNENGNIVIKKLKIYVTDIDTGPK